MFLLFCFLIYLSHLVVCKQLNCLNNNSSEVCILNDINCNHSISYESKLFNYPSCFTKWDEPYKLRALEYSKYFSNALNKVSKTSHFALDVNIAHVKVGIFLLGYCFHLYLQI